MIRPDNRVSYFFFSIKAPEYVSVRCCIMIKQTIKFPAITIYTVEKLLVSNFFTIHKMQETVCTVLYWSKNEYQQEYFD